MHSAAMLQIILTVYSRNRAVSSNSNPSLATPYANSGDVSVYVKDDNSSTVDFNEWRIVAESEAGPHQRRI